MGQIFISAGHGGAENGEIDTGARVAGTTEAQEMIQLRDLVVPELRSRGFSVLSVPDELSLLQTITWINARSRSGDVALEIHADAFNNPAARGASVFHIDKNEARKAHAELLLIALLRRVPQLPSRGAKPDTATGLGKLAFCRRLTSASLLMEVGFLTNPQDRELIQTRPRDFALGIADGLAAWSRAVNGDPIESGQATEFPEVSITLNGGRYGENGIIVSNNAYIPIDLIDQLGVDLAAIPEVRRVQYRNIVYVKAIELRDFNISVGWESATRTLLLRSQAALTICPGLVDRIAGHGNTSEVQLMMFLKSNNESGLEDFPDLPKLYREEASTEGINFDIAFCQMCVETAFLRFGREVKPAQNNFAGIGAVGGGAEGASFGSARLGVRAHIQHLKAYANREPLVEKLVDPRFSFVSRGTAPLVGQLSGRWAADPQYGDKILAVLRRLYESAGLL